MTQALPVQISGEVTEYKGNGRKLGYPTANINVPTDLADGVYFGYADLSEFDHHPTIIFIGTPTTMGDTERRVEAHLFDIPDKNYYGLNLRLDVEKFHRENQTFPSKEALIKVMHEDEQTARDWFKDQS